MNVGFPKAGTVSGGESTRGASRCRILSSAVGCKELLWSPPLTGHTGADSNEQSWSSCAQIIDDRILCQVLDPYQPFMKILLTLHFDAGS